MTSFSLRDRIKVKGEFVNDVIVPKRSPREEHAFKQKNPVTNKGEEDGACNVTACQKPHASYYNKVMHKWYCRDCAIKIESAARRDNMSFYDQLEGVALNGYG